MTLLRASTCWIISDGLNTSALHIHVNNDNDNILFEDNVQTEIIIFSSSENHIINWFGD